MTLKSMMMTRRFARQVAAFLLITAALFGGVLHSCNDNNREGSGMWQGGGDSSPSWR